MYFTESAIKTIVNYKTSKNVLFGTSIAKNEAHENWGEPFAYVVNDYKTFMNGIENVKILQDEGKTNRVALVWELYRYLNELDINIQQVLDDTYICIDDGTIDIDDPEQIDELNKEIEPIRKEVVLCKDIIERSKKMEQNLQELSDEKDQTKEVEKNEHIR